MERHNEVLDALETLHKKYPTERVDIWISWQPGKLALQYTAMVDGKLGAQCFCTGWHDSAADAAQSLMDRAGERNPETLKAAKIAELKARLAALDAK